MVICYVSLPECKASGRFSYQVPGKFNGKILG